MHEIRRAEEEIKLPLSYFSAHDHIQPILDMNWKEGPGASARYKSRPGSEGQTQDCAAWIESVNFHHYGH